MKVSTFTIKNPNTWILAYDVRCERRLAKVHRQVRLWGQPLQYSVFLLQGDRAKIKERMDELAQIIDASEDDVRAYSLAQFSKWKLLGCQHNPMADLVLTATAAAGQGKAGLDDDDDDD